MCKEPSAPRPQPCPFMACKLLSSFDFHRYPEDAVYSAYTILPPQARDGRTCERMQTVLPMNSLSGWLLNCKKPPGQHRSCSSVMDVSQRNRARAVFRKGKKHPRQRRSEFRRNKQKRAYMKLSLQASMLARILASTGRCRSCQLCPLRPCVRGAATSHARTRPPSPATPCPCGKLVCNDGPTETQTALLDSPALCGAEQKIRKLRKRTLHYARH